MINGVTCWTITSQHDYVKATVKNVKEAIKRIWQLLPTSNIDTPMNITYTPKLDVTRIKRKWQYLVSGIDRRFAMDNWNWISRHSPQNVFLLQYQASPRVGHFNHLLHILAFFKKHPKLTLNMSPKLSRIDYGEFLQRRQTSGRWIVMLMLKSHSHTRSHCHAAEPLPWRHLLMCHMQRINWRDNPTLDMLYSWILTLW